jgi:hypothetical protein
MTRIAVSEVAERARSLLQTVDRRLRIS